MWSQFYRYIHIYVQVSKVYEAVVVNFINVNFEFFYLSFYNSKITKIIKVELYFLYDMSVKSKKAIIL